MKKILAIFMLLLIVGVSSNMNFAKANSDYEKSDKFFSEEEFNVISNQSKEMKKFRDFISKYEKKFIFESEYGGAYLDDGELVINVVNINDKDKFKKENGLNENQRVKIVDHSLNELNKEMKKIEKYLDENIQSVKRDDMNNTIVISYIDLTDSQMEKISKSSTISDIIFIQIETLPVTTASYTVYNGDGLDLNDDGLDDVTIGFGAINNSTGQRGIVTAGHIEISGYEEDDNIYYNGRLAGTFDVIQWSGTVDASFASLRDAWYRFPKFYNTDVYQIDGVLSGMYSDYKDYSDTILQGSTIYGKFNVSGNQSGTVSYASSSQTYCGEDTSGSTVCRTITDMIESDVRAVRGDSGGSLLYYEYPYLPYPFHVAYLISIQSGSYLPGETGDGWTVDSYSFSSKAVNILEDLDLTLYQN